MHRNDTICIILCCMSWDSDVRTVTLPTEKWRKDLWKLKIKTCQEKTLDIDAAIGYDRQGDSNGKDCRTNAAV